MIETIRLRTAAAAAIVPLLLAGCDDDSPQPPKDPVSTVFAAVETAPMPDADDAADDPAIWIHPGDPAQSVVIGTNKQRGLVVYGLDGAILSTRDDGRMNNVDLRQGIALGEGVIDVVAATNRTDQTIALYRMDAASRTLMPLSPSIPSGFADPYGICMYRSAATGDLYVIANDTGGAVTQWRVTPREGDQVAVAQVRSFAVPSQPEGCVADDETGVLFLGEENAGLWTFPAEPDAEAAGTMIDTVAADGHLAADVEGITLFDAGEERGYVIASSQGSNSYNVYDRAAPHAFRGAFVIGDEPGAIDGTSDTDGIAVTSAPLGGAFSDGLFVAQDGSNTAPAANQNFKLVPWARIRDALKLE